MPFRPGRVTLPARHWLAAAGLSERERLICSSANTGSLHDASNADWGSEAVRVIAWGVGMAGLGGILS